MQGNFGTSNTKGRQRKKIDRIDDVGDNEDQVNMLAGLLRCDNLVEPTINHGGIKYILEDMVWHEVGVKKARNCWWVCRSPGRLAEICMRKH